MQLQICFNEGILWFWCVSILFVYEIILVFVAFIELLGLVDALFRHLCGLVFVLSLWDLSGHASTGPLGAWVRTKVLDPLRACVKVADCFDPSSTGTLTCIKLKHVLRAFCHCVRTIRNSGLSSFILVRMIRLRLHCIKSPNQRSLITNLRSCNLTAVRNRAKGSNPFD
jgi:hypothetical protein